MSSTLPIPAACLRGCCGSPVVIRTRASLQRPPGRIKSKYPRLSQPIFVFCFSFARLSNSCQVRDPDTDNVASQGEGLSGMGRPSRSGRKALRPTTAAREAQRTWRRRPKSEYPSQTGMVAHARKRVGKGPLLLADRSAGHPTLARMRGHDGYVVPQRYSDRLQRGPIRTAPLPPSVLRF